MTVSGTLALAILHRVRPGNVRQWIVTSLAARNLPAASRTKAVFPDRSDRSYLICKRPGRWIATGPFLCLRSSDIHGVARRATPRPGYCLGSVLVNVPSVVLPNNKLSP